MRDAVCQAAGVAQRRAQGGFPKADPEARAAFEALLPDDPGVAVRPMFGNVAAFVDGNMFAGVFGADLFVRLDDDSREQLIAEGGARFEPMPGRPMREYVTLPPTWHDDHRRARGWLERSLDWARTLPPKRTKPS